MKDFLKLLGMDIKSDISPNNVLTADLTEAEWAKCLSTLDKSELVDEIEESSNITYESATQQFISNDYLITLAADLENNTFKLTMKEKDN